VADNNEGGGGNCNGDGGRWAEEILAGVCTRTVLLGKQWQTFGKF
jgi:hypothetical protein